jgi:acetoin utilization deacetylase AcuC-like enzyme
MTTAFLYDPRFLEHDAGYNHPERPERLTAVINHVSALPWFSGLSPVTPQPATMDQIETIHALSYIRRAKRSCRDDDPFLDTPDVGISRKSAEIAFLAAGGAIAVADSVMSGKSKNGFALLRPPGHHAENSSAMGFCLFNNIAITAKHIQKLYGVHKVLIVDWDVHHGNGTQHSFEDDPSVLYVSLHQYPFYPGTGSAGQTGIGRGEGYTLNCPMTAGSGDTQYMNAWTEKILPKLNGYQPQVILISAGFDAHQKDPLASMNLSTQCFGWMTDQLKEIAERYCGGKIISMLEGGYDLAALSECVSEHLEHLIC